MIRRYPFTTFCAVVGLLVGSALMFIQSPRFARVIKKIVARHLPADLGIQGDFSEFSIGLFPPSVSIKNPKVSLSSHNLINLPAGSSVVAQRIDLRFQLFQMLSGQIKVHEVAIVDGEVNLILHPAKSSAKKKSIYNPNVNWDELLQIRAEAISIENTKIHLQSADSDFTADAMAERLRLSQWKGKGGQGYELRADFRNLNSTVLKNFLPVGGIGRLSAVAHVNASGIQIDDVLTVSEGLELRIAGNIDGNILADKNLKLTSQVNLSGDLTTISGFFKDSKLLGLGGHVEFVGKFKGDLSALAETAHAEGNLKAEDVKFQEWAGDRVVADASYSGSMHGGEFSVSHAEISSKEISREGGNHPAHGGKLEIGSFRYELGSNTPVKLPIKFERAAFHWLGAAHTAKVYPLDFRMSGPADLLINPAPKNWSVNAAVDLLIEEFVVDNQRPGKQKPLKRVFKIQPLKLSGPLIIDSHGLKAHDVQLILPHSRLDINGAVDPKTGYNLVGEGEIKLADIGEIAEKPITGDGPIKVTMHGPLSQLLVDVDADLTNASYLGLKFGAMKGRVTWDDDPNNLIFNHVQAQKGETNYSANGTVFLGVSDTIDMDLVFPSGNIKDVSDIFENLVSDVWWYPHAMSGPVHGSAKISGGLDLSKLSVLADLNGTNWQWMGERVRSIALRGGFVHGGYLVSEMRGLKETGRFSGKISYDAEKRFDWDIKTQNFEISDLGHIARLDVPLRGQLEISSHGKGKESSLQSSTSVQLTGLSVRGVSFPSSQVVMKTEAGVATVKGTALGGQGNMDLSYGLTEGTPSMIRAELHQLDFSPLILLLNPKLMQDPLLTGVLSGNLKMSFRSGELEKGTGSYSIQEYRLTKTGASFRLSHPVDVNVSDGNFVIKDLSVEGGNGVASLNMRGHPTELNGTVTGNLDLSILEFITSTIGKGSGVADLDFGIEGVLKKPIIYGKAELDDGAFRIPSIDSPIENITGTLLLRDQIISLQNLQANLAGGRMTASGTVELYADKYPALSLKGELNGSRIKVFPFQFAKLRGTLGVTGLDRPYLIDGNLTIDSALIRENVLGGQKGESLKTLQYTPVNSGKAGGIDADIPLFKLKINVGADRGILVQNDLFNAELKSHVTLVNTIEAPRVLGSAELIQGKMSFKNRDFQIQSASATFDNPTTIDPAFNLTANTDVGNTKVQLYISGRMSNYKLDLTSNPSMAETEILSLLAIGDSGGFAQKSLGNSTDHSQAQQGEAASLILQSMNFNKDIQDKTGFEILLDETANPLQAQSIFSAKAPTENTTVPKIVVRRRIGNRISISYGSTVGVGTNKENDLNAEFRLTQGLSAVGVYENYESQDETRKDTQNSYGVDLKLQKRFK